MSALPATSNTAPPVSSAPMKQKSSALSATARRLSNASILGHRGARGEAFENSLAGFVHLQKLAQRQDSPVVGVEFDVQLTQDGQLVVFHDDTLARLYGRQVRVNQLSNSEIAKLVSHNPSMTLPDILQLSDMPALLQNYTHIELEVKTHNRTNYAQLVAALQRIFMREDFRALPITITTFDTQLLTRLYSSKNDFKTGLLIAPLARYRKPNMAQTEPSIEAIAKNWLYSMPNLARRLGCTHIGFYHPLIDAKLIDICRHLQLSNSAWTVNSSDEAKRLIEMGTHYIISDYPSTLLQN